MLLEKKKFLCLIGMDGSGKTTLAKYLCEKLYQKNISYKYVHSLVNLNYISWLFNIGRNFIYKNGNVSSNYARFRDRKKSFYSAHPNCARIYRVVVSSNYAAQVLFKISLPILKGQKIISDRYIYDTVTYMSLNFGYDATRIASEIRKWFRFFPEPDITFLIDIDEQTAFDRKDDVPSIDYLKERRQLYLNLAESFSMKVLDGNKTTKELFEDIQRTLFNE